jgi:hypothetical protein
MSTETRQNDQETPSGVSPKDLNFTNLNPSFHNSTQSIRRRSSKRIWWRITLAFLAVYLGIAISLGIFNQRTYKYSRQNFLYQTTTILLQPLMEVVGQGKTGHQYNWQPFRSDKIPNQIQTVKVYAKRPNSTRFEPGWLSGLREALDWRMEAVILAPADKKMDKPWSLIFCQNDEFNQIKKCFRNDIMHQGQIKMLIIGSGEIWGMDTDGQIFDLRVINYVPRTERTDLLFV